jgi:hypothetical protein
MDSITEQSVSRVSTAPAQIITSPQVSGSSRAARAHRIIARVLLGALAIQFFFAGLGVFDVASFLPHIIFGTLIVIASFALPIIAWRGRLARTRALRSWALAGLMIIQGGLIDLGRIWPLVAAFHPMNAMILALLTFSLI